MPYAKISNGQVEMYPYSIRNLKADNPQTSFPKDLSEEFLAQYGMEPVTFSEPPLYDGRTQGIGQEFTPKLTGGDWVIGYTTEDKSEEEVADFDNLTASSNRAVRDELLTKSDWTQISDTPLDGDSKGGWAGYRVELRDLTNHINWPNLNEEDWPMKP